MRTGFDLEQTRHREMVLVDEAGKEHLGIPLKFRNEPGRVRFAAPALGQHTDEVLASLGYGEAEIAGLREARVV